MTMERSEMQFATKEDLDNLATKADVGKFATKMDMASVHEELVKLRRELADTRWVLVGIGVVFLLRLILDVVARVS